MAFKTSVNIRFDVGKDEFINRYIPTPSHTEVLKGILEGFISESNRSHIIVGAYGTGKSLLATVISSIVSKNASTVSVEKLIKKFAHFDDHIAAQIDTVSKLEKTYLPVLLTGNEGRFRQAILTSILKALKAEKIEVILPGVSEKIIESINTWKLDFPDTYENFIKELEVHGKEIEKWKERIKNQDEEEIAFFREIYPTLSSGASFNIGFNVSFLSQMEYLINVLNNHNLGLMIVYDEFGRFLQGLDRSSLNETMQDIQDLAELADREKALHFLLITHKSLRQYFRGMHEDIVREFQRIEKRFRQYNITSDQVTFLKIAEVILTENIQTKPEISNENYIQTANALKQYSLFPSLNPSDREHVIVKSMYPLHPISLFMLPYLSNIFGQNERTLFTFLESEESGGLLNHIKKSASYYRPYQLFDYFFSDASENDVDVEVSKNLLLYNKAIARIPDTLIAKELALSIIKFISLWNLCGLQKEQKLSTDFLLFAMQSNETEMVSLLDTLSKHKVIRFNRLGEYWEIHSGSALDIQGLISKTKLGFIPEQSEIMKVLHKNLGTKYYFPERYNDEKEMTRFANVELITESHLEQFSLYQQMNTDSDLTIYYVIPEYKRAEELSDDIVKLSRARKDIFAIHPVPLSFIKEEIQESIIIEALLSNRELLSEDKGIKEELKIIIKEINHVIGKYLSTLNNFEQNIIWISSMERTSITSSIGLSEYLSKKCHQLYGKTPVIINDSFNRMNCSSQQKAGAKLLIDSIIKSSDVLQFGIEGSGPAYAIYASLFKNNENFDQNVNNLDYQNIEYEPYRLLRNKLIDLLDKQPSGNFADIIEIFSGTPFGIRKPVIPILLVAMLRDRWNEFILYRNEIFVPGLNGSKLYEILEEEGPENYQYDYEQIDEDYIRFFNSIEEVFSDFIEDRLEGQDNSRLIQICGTLVKWLRSLPRYTQISDAVSSDFSNLRDLIRRTEVKPQQSITDIFNLYQNNIMEMVSIKNYAEGFLAEVKEALQRTVIQVCNATSHKDICTWALNQHEYLKKNDELIKSILISEESEDWISVFLENYTGVRVDDWSDKTYEKFLNDLEQNYQGILNFYKGEEGSDNGVNKESQDFITLEIENNTKVISKVEFSVKAKTVYTNIDRILRNAGRNIPKNEMEYMIYLLLEKYVE